MGIILVTGCAGFIGSHLCLHLLKQGKQVLGIDNFSSYYDKSLKEENLKNILSFKNFEFRALCVSECQQLSDRPIDLVIHLAATPGVTPSLNKIQAYIDNNISNYNYLLAYMKKNSIKKLIFTSSSSVYGNQSREYYPESIPLQPISPYGFTKQVGEQLNYQYHNLYNISVFNLRLFSVYGNRMRPDLALPQFLSRILNYQPITLYNHGKDYRDFTHIEDIIDAFCNTIEYLNQPINCYETINVGCGAPVQIVKIVQMLEQITGIKAIYNYAQKRQGEVLYTAADIHQAQELLNYQPKVAIQAGLRQYCKWFMQKHGFTTEFHASTQR